MNEEMIRYIQHELNRLGVGMSGEERMDAGEVAFIAQQLEHMTSRLYEVRYERLKARTFLPVSTEADPGAEAIAWEVWDEVGEAKILANDADDIPLVEATSEKDSKIVKTVASAYAWSILDVWRAAKAGRPLPERKARASRRAIERQIDNIGAFGIPNTSARGLLNTPGVPAGNVTTGGWTAGGGIDPRLIINDLNELVVAIVNSTKGELPPDTVLLPTREYAHIATTRFGEYDARSILDVFLAQSPWIKGVDWWPALDEAGAGGSRRMVVYPRDPEVVEWDIPLDFFQLPPQTKGLGFMVPCLARVSGVTIHHPSAVRYGDGL